jgi:hypothetical protein
VILDLDEFDRLPEELFAASVSPHLGRSEMLFELRETKAGQLAIMLYSSLPALVRACGTGQAWTKIHNVDLPWLARTVGFDVLVFDLALPAELRNPDLHATEFPDLDAIPADRNPMDKIYVPSKPFRDGDRQVRMELQPDQDGNPALLVYFSAEQLRAGCGPHQPWVAFPIKDLRWLARRAGARSVLFNAILNDAARHPASTRTNKRTR